MEGPAGRGASGLRRLRVPSPVGEEWMSVCPGRPLSSRPVPLRVMGDAARRVYLRDGRGLSGDAPRDRLGNEVHCYTCDTLPGGSSDFSHNMSAYTLVRSSEFQGIWCRCCLTIYWIEVTLVQIAGPEGEGDEKLTRLPPGAFLTTRMNAKGMSGALDEEVAPAVDLARISQYKYVAIDSPTGLVKAFIFRQFVEIQAEMSAEKPRWFVVV